MATDAHLTSVQIDNAFADNVRDSFDRVHQNTTKRALIITYEWIGKGVPPNLKELMEHHLNVTQYLVETHPDLRISHEQPTT